MSPLTSGSLLVIATALSGYAVAQDSCPLGNSTDHCGYAADGITVSGDFPSPCSCQSTLCCSVNGFCGPEPGITNQYPKACYCGAGCQEAYGNCNPGPVYFEYIGTGDASPDTVSSNPQAIPVPATDQFYFIVFLLSDQVANPGGGQSTGDFRPVGLYEVGSSPATGTWDQAAIQRLTTNRSPNVKVIASIAGDTGTTKWAGVPSVSAYVQSATASLQSYLQAPVVGFDIDYEESIVGADGVTDPSWLSAWCQIITNLKENGATITFAPFSNSGHNTTQAYKDLQNCLATANTNIDFVIYQTYAMDTPWTLTDQNNTLTHLQAMYAPTKIIAGVSNDMLNSNPDLVSQLISPLLANGVITGASVFDADESSVLSSPYTLERQLFCNSAGGCQ